MVGMLYQRCFFQFERKHRQKKRGSATPTPSPAHLSVSISARGGKFNTQINMPLQEKCEVGRLLPHDLPPNLNELHPGVVPCVLLPYFPNPN